MVVESRFWNKVRIGSPDECWVWLGGHTQEGYGRYHLGKEENFRLVLAHRHSYDIVYGIQDTTKQIHHTCDNPRCVNFHHLEEVTFLENMRAKPAKPATSVYQCGHPRIKENTYRSGNKTRCKICQKEYMRKHRK